MTITFRSQPTPPWTPDRGSRRPAWARRFPPLLFLTALVAFIVGCEENPHFYNHTGFTARSITITVHFDGPVDALALFVDKWYSGCGVPQKAIKVSPTEWKLTWDLTNNPVVDGLAFHAGATFHGVGVTGYDVCWEEVYQPFPQSPAHGAANRASVGCDPIAGPVVRPRFDPTLGLVVDLSNGSDPSAGSVTVTNLRWARSNTAIPLDALLPGDPTTEGLPWQNVPVGVPLTLNAGAPPVVVDVPDGLARGGYLFARALYNNSKVVGTAGETFSEGPGLPLPASGPMGGWPLGAALGLGMAAVATIRLRAVAKRARVE